MKKFARLDIVLTRPSTIPGTKAEWEKDVYFNYDYLLDLHHCQGGYFDDCNIMPYIEEYEGTTNELRWRAEKGEYYYTIIDEKGKFKAHKTIENDYPICATRYNEGNYFRTEEEAQEKLNQINTIIKK